MNDFTKEELEFLKHSVREHYKNNPPIKGSTYVNVWADMIKKLQSMIDNYCEHECIHETNSITTSGIIHSCEGDIYKPFKCKKCGEYYDNQ